VLLLLLPLRIVIFMHFTVTRLAGRIIAITRRTGWRRKMAAVCGLVSVITRLTGGRSTSCVVVKLVLVVVELVVVLRRHHGVVVVMTTKTAFHVLTELRRTTTVGLDHTFVDI